MTRYLCFATQSAVNLPLPTAYASCIQVVYIFIYDFGMPLDDHPCLDSLVDNPDYEDPFNARHAEQVSRAMYDLLTEMCSVTKNETFDDLTPENLDKKYVSKEKMCQWLGAFVHMLNRFANPHLQMAVERLDVMNTDLLKEKDRTIELQSKLIEKHDEELQLVKAAIQDEVKSVQNVVETEMKSYSSALKSTCSAALAPKKICAAVRTVSEKVDRSHNVIVYGLKESSCENLEAEISKVLAEIDERPTIMDCCRVGVSKQERLRPVKFTLRSSDMVKQILRKAKALRTKDGFSNVYISPDRTVEERRAFKKLWDELQEKRKVDPDKVHYIKNNKIVSAQKS